MALVPQAIEDRLHMAEEAIVELEELEAKRKELLAIPVAELLKVESKQETAKMYFPEKKGGGLVLEGEVGDLADQLIKILKDKTAVLA